MNKQQVILVSTILCLLLVSVYSAPSEYYYLVSASSPKFLPETIYSSDTFSIALDVSNKGSYYSITDLNATLILGDQFEEIENFAHTDLIKPESTKTLVFTVKAKNETIQGYYPATIRFDYIKNGDPVFSGEDIRNETITIIIPVSRSEKNINVTVSPESISPSTPSTITFTLQNASEQTISNVSFSWNESTNLVLPIGSDNKRYIESIAPNSSANITYMVAADPNIETGIYPLEISVSYNDNNGTTSQDSVVGLLVGGGTDFEISAENNNGVLSISIANIGSNNADAVVAKLLPSNGITITGSTTSILGSLNKGDFTIASFQIQTNSLSSQNQTQNNSLPAGNPLIGAETKPTMQDTNRQLKNSSNITIQIDYTDTTGKRQSIKKTIELSSNSSQITSAMAQRTKQNQSSIIIPIALGILFIGLLVGVNHFKSHKSKKIISIGIIASIIIFSVVIFFLNSDFVSSIIAFIILVAIGFFLLKDTGKNIESIKKRV